MGISVADSISAAEPSVLSLSTYVGRGLRYQAMSPDPKP